METKFVAIWTTRRWGLLWNAFKVLTKQQVEDLLEPAYYRENGIHCQHAEYLRKASSDVSFALPPFLAVLRELRKRR